MCRLLQELLHGQARTLLKSEERSLDGMAVFRKLDATCVGEDSELLTNHLNRHLNVKERENQNVQACADYHRECEEDM